MRRCLGVVVIGLLILQGGCQEDSEIGDEPNGGGVVVVAAEKVGEITFERLEYDFGRMRPGARKVGELAFSNTGAGLLKISKVETCCGAVSKTDKSEYQPGEGGVLKVEYVAGRRQSTIKKELFVLSNDATTPKVGVTIKIEVVPRVVFKPTFMELTLAAENAGCMPITFESTDGQPFSIRRFESAGGGITAEVDGTAEATKIVVDPKADVGKLINSMKGTIAVDLVYSEPNSASETEYISYRVLPRFSVKPSMITFSYGEDRTPVRKLMWVQSNYDEAFEIESTSSKDGRVKILSQERDGDGKRYELSVEVSLPTGDEKRFTDRFYIRLKDGERLEVFCLGMYSEKSLP